MNRPEAREVPTRRPFIIIRTLPLSAGNYGGIVQTWALQQVLSDLGLDSATDTSQSSPARTSLRGRGKQLLKRIVLNLPMVPIRNVPLIAEHLKPKLDIRLREFVDQHISTIALFSSRGTDTAVSDRADGFLVGSDQVWRARWSDVRSYLFDFLSQDDDRPRVAYAASFGRDDLDEYDRALIEEAAVLSKRLTAISVREHSGIRICEAEWGVTAETHVDPTLLLSPSRYADLTSGARRLRAAPYLASYVLDGSADSHAIVERVAHAKGLPVLSLTTESPETMKAFRQDRPRYTRPSVQEWVAAIADADYVVTDSFHGTVFAILHNKPFISIVNRSRGASRFESLLSRFGLEQRLVEPGIILTDELIDRTIDWRDVNHRLESERERGLAFLRASFATVRSQSDSERLS